MIAINQQLYWRMAELRTKLEAATPNTGYQRDQIQGLVKTLSRLGHVPSHKPPDCDVVRARRRGTSVFTHPRHRPYQSRSEKLKVIGALSGVREPANNELKRTPARDDVFILASHSIRSTCMEFKDVEEVVTTGTTAGANDLLGKGWALLAVVAGTSGPDFVLGRAKGADQLPGKKSSAEILKDAGL